MSQLKNYIKIARPDHWIKNVFILPGVVLAVILIDTPDDWKSFVVKLIAGFLATCFVASANYVINEWLDAEFDKFHPTKKYRPVVSQNMKFGLVMLEYAVCIVIGAALSFAGGGTYVRASGAVAFADGRAVQCKARPNKGYCVP